MQPLRNIWLIALSTGLEGFRHRILWAIVTLALLLTLANLGIAQFFSWDIGKISVEFGLSAVAFTGLLIIFFLAMKILADDFERHRITMLLSRPVTAAQYVLGKFVGLGLILFVSTCILGFSAALSMYYVLSSYPAFVPPNFSWLTYVMALCCQLMTLNIMLSVMFFCFSFASQSFVALLLSVSVYFVGQNMELLRKVVLENAHAGIVAGQGTMVLVLSWIFPNLSLFDKKYTAAYGFPFSSHEFILLFCYATAYCILMLWFSILFFKRKELT